MYTGPDGRFICAAGLAARDTLWKNSLKPWTMNLRMNCHTSAVIGFRHSRIATSYKEGQGELLGKPA